MKRWVHAATEYTYEQLVKDCAKAIQQIVKKSNPGIIVETTWQDNAKDIKVKMNSSVFKFRKGQFVTVVETNVFLPDEALEEYKQFLDRLDKEIQAMVAADYPDLEAKWGRYPGRFSRGADYGYLVRSKA